MIRFNANQIFCAPHGVSKKFENQISIRVLTYHTPNIREVASIKLADVPCWDESMSVLSYGPKTSVIPWFEILRSMLKRVIVNPPMNMSKNMPSLVRCARGACGGKGCMRMWDICRLQCIPQYPSLPISGENV